MKIITLTQIKSRIKCLVCKGVSYLFDKQCQCCYCCRVCSHRFHRRRLVLSLKTRDNSLIRKVLEPLLSYLVCLWLAYGKEQGILFCLTFCLNVEVDYLDFKFEYKPQRHVAIGRSAIKIRCSVS